MPLTHMELAELIPLFASFFDKGLAPVIADIPEIVPLLPQLKTTHGLLLATQPAAEGEDKGQRADLAHEQKKVDGLHDHSLRAFWYLLTARFEYLLALGTTAALDEAVRLKQVRDAAVPDGLGMAQLAYAIEAGNAARAQELVTKDAAARASLASVHLAQDVTALDVLALWAGHGTRLGQLGSQKNALDGQEGQPAAPAHSQPSHVRRAAISLLSTTLSVLRHSNAPADRVKALRSAIETAASRAEERFLARKGPKGSTEADTSTSDKG